MDDPQPPMSMQPLQSGTRQCKRCKGTGAYLISGAGAECPDCDGYGQTTDCPLCQGKGCWDCCDTGRVSGP